MKKYLAVILAAVLAALLLTACSQSEPPVQSEELGDPVPMEYIISNTDLTEADFEGIDYEAFMSHMGYTMDNIDDKLPLIPRLIGFYREEQEKIELYGPDIDYSVIYQQSKGRLEEEDLDKIEVIICDYHEGTYNEYIVIDYSTNKVYSSMNDIIGRCNDALVTSELTQADREWIRNVLAENNITSWRNSYKGTSAGTTGHFGMGFAFRLTDGRCVSYSTSGVMLSGRPAEMNVLFSEMSERFFEYN